MRRLALLGLMLAAACSAAPRWTVKYFFDQDRAGLQFTDLTFPTPRRGLAVGVRAVEGKAKPVMVSTADAGETWTVRELDEFPRSLFFLDQNRGWMVTENGIWTTDEAGLSWRKILKRKGLIRVYFTSGERGFAVGTEKTLLATSDGGRTWAGVADAAKPEVRKETTAYHWIAFANERAGIVIGRSQTARLRRRSEEDAEQPALSLILETRDGGATWKHSTVSLFGAITRLRLLPSGQGLALTEFAGKFKYPSEVLELDLRDGKSARVLAQKDFGATDILALPGGQAYAFGRQSAGELASTPIPGKLRVLTSRDLRLWLELPVDYRANAGRVTGTASPDGTVWCATDTGMILKLEP